MGVFPVAGFILVLSQQFTNFLFYQFSGLFIIDDESNSIVSLAVPD